MHFKTLYSYVLNQLNIAKVFEFKAETKLIFEHFCQKKLYELNLENSYISPDITKLILECAKNRAATNKPLSYILGVKNFYGHDFLLNDSCLIPRFDSEILVEKTYETIKHSSRLKKDIKILDICSGSGCLGISLAHLLGNNFNVTLTLLDISESVLEISLKNAQKIIPNANVIAKNLDIMKCNIPDGHDIILANPPYIPTNEIENLDSQVKHFEPKIALDGGADGLNFYRKINNYIRNTSNNFIFALEFGKGQAKAIRDIFHGFKMQIYQDLAGIERCGIVCKMD